MIDYSSALKWMGQFRRTGNVQPKRQGGYRQSLLLQHMAWLLGWIEDKADWTLAEIRQSLSQERDSGRDSDPVALLSTSSDQLRAQEQGREEIAQFTPPLLFIRLI